MNIYINDVPIRKHLFMCLKVWTSGVLACILQMMFCSYIRWAITSWWNLRNIITFSIPLAYVTFQDTAKGNPNSLNGKRDCWEKALVERIYVFKQGYLDNNRLSHTRWFWVTAPFLLTGRPSQPGYHRGKDCLSALSFLS